ncbi:MAG: hypothetical protein RRZ92_04365 [Bacilli bacterium]
MKNIYTLILPLSLLVGCGDKLPREAELIPLINDRVGRYGHQVVKLDRLKCKAYSTGSPSKDYECSGVMQFADNTSMSQTFQLSRDNKGSLTLYAVGR